MSSKVPINEARINSAKEKYEPIVKAFVESESGSLYAYCQENSIQYLGVYKYIKKHRKDILLSVEACGKSKRRKLKDEQRRNSIDSSEIQRLYDMGMTFAEIGKKYGKCAATICGWFKRYGLKPRSTSEKVKLWMTDEHRERFRKMANDGLIGVHSWKKTWQELRTTWIEKALEDWLLAHGIEYTREFQIELGTHRFDFRLIGTNILIETDGVYFHSRRNQVEKDRNFDAYAKDMGYVVIRFTDKEIKTTNKKCFESILHEIK